MAQAEPNDEVRLDADQALAAVCDGAGARPEQPGYGPQRRGLAGAVAPEDGHDLAGFGRQGDALQGFDVAVKDMEVVDLEKRQG